MENYKTIMSALATEAVRIKGNKSVYAKPAVCGQIPTVSEDQFKDVDCDLTTDTFVRLFHKRWRTAATTILSLVELYKYRTSTKETTILYLPTTSRYLTDVFGSQRNVSNVIDRAERIGLLKCVNEDYLFGVDGRSKLYAWNKRVERAIIALCKAEGIEPAIRHSVTMERVLRDSAALSGTAKAKAEGLDIRITQRTALPKTLTDEEVIAAILDRYPEIRDAMETAVRLNKVLPESEQISAMPRITRSKNGTITKIGFRVTNPMVSAKVHDNANDDYHGPWLRDLLKTKFGVWVEYDVKSSIYRVSHLLADGEWLDDSIDLYPEMAGFGMSGEARANYKLLAMSLYFENSPQSLVAHYKAKGLNLPYSDEELVSAINEARGRMRDVCGESCRSEIFVAESCIYLEAYRRMVEEKGWQVVEVYDGFHIRLVDGMDAREVRDEAARIVEDCAYWYINKYFGER